MGSGKNIDCCLEVGSGVYSGRIITLDYQKNKALLDIEPVLDYHFRERDKFLGLPVGYPRSVRTDFGKRYFFGKVELAEAFMRNNSPDKTASFFEQHLPEDDLLAESFLNQIRLFERMHRIVAVTSVPGEKGSGSWYFHPINFKEEELEYLISSAKGVVFSNRRLKRTEESIRDEKWKRKFIRPLIYDSNYRNLRKLKKTFEREEPAVALAVIRRVLPENLFDMIKGYGLSTEGLGIVRIR